MAPDGELENVMHSELLHQLKKLQLNRDTPPDHAAWQLFLDRINASYEETDQKSSSQARDVTDAKKLETKSQLIGQVVQAAAEGVVILDTSRNVVSVNPAYEEMFGVSAEDVLGAEAGFCTDINDPDVYDQIWKKIDKDGSWQGELTARRSDGDEFPLWMTLDAAHMRSKTITHYVALLTDFSEIKQSRQELEHIAMHDSLTGLPNRILFQDRLQQAVSRSLRTGKPGAVLFLDLDRFKVINDNLGHQVGDELLIKVAERLTTLLRKEDTLARLGGDEFTLVIELLDGVEQVDLVAEKVLHAFAEPFQPGELKLEITTSVGISIFPDDGTDVDALTKQADIAMYSAKEAGRNRYRFFTQDLRSSENEFFSMEQDLRKALPREELSLVYQPQFNLENNQLIGFESLLRWTSPQRGEVGPGKFIPVAEITGQIETIGAWVIEEVCRQIVTWKRHGRDFGRIAINLSRRQLAGAKLIPTVKEILTRFGVDGSQIEFEITEGSIIEQDDVAYRNLLQLDDMGVELAIDDFGTGHSSLINLKRFPLSRLKIDRRFVKDVDRDPNDEGIIKATIALGQSLGMKVIAEGVETQQQLEFLRDAGCNEVQGFLLGKPVSASKTEALFERLAS
jgi:diguanylate cyclase (GGDEF)-like protein/PAS domain S-box-containing protein